jgi:hypothetical protein
VKREKRKKKKIIVDGWRGISMEAGARMSVWLRIHRLPGRQIEIFRKNGRERMGGDTIAG